MNFGIQVNMPIVAALHNPANNQMGAHLIQALNERNDAWINQILSSPNAHQIPPLDLGTALALSFEHFQDRYYRRILALPAAQNIPANGLGGIGHSLAVVCRRQEPDGFNSIIHHPNFIHIPANGPYSLSEAMAAYLTAFIRERELPDDPNPAYLAAIIHHPHAQQINSTQQLSDLIGESLLRIAVQSEEVFRKEDEQIVNLLLHVNIAHLVSPNGQFGLGRIMANAAFSTTPSILASLLAHPQVLHVNPANMRAIDKTTAEDAWDLNEFGFESALFLAVNNGDPQVQDPRAYQTQIVQALIDFTNINRIALNANTPFGLADSLTEASNLSNELTLLILNSHSSIHIQPQAPDQDSGGLNNALINSVNEGLLGAVQGLLQHPHAAQIPIEDLRQSVRDAIHLNYPIIAETVRDYALQAHGVIL